MKGRIRGTMGLPRQKGWRLDPVNGRGGTERVAAAHARGCAARGCETARGTLPRGRTLSDNLLSELPPELGNLKALKKL